MRLLLICLLLLTSPAFARDHIVLPMELHCFKADILIKQLRDGYGEDPIFVGKSELDGDAVTMMFVNQQTGSYTVVAMGKVIGCVLDTGNNVRYRMPKILENKPMM